MFQNEIIMKFLVPVGENADRDRRIMGVSIWDIFVWWSLKWKAQ